MPIDEQETRGWWWRTLLAAAAITLAMLLAAGCNGTVAPPALESAATRLETIRQAAETVVGEAKAGKAEVPAGEPHWSRIEQAGGSIVQQAVAAKSDVIEGQNQQAKLARVIEDLRKEQEQASKTLNLVVLLLIGGAVAFGVLTQSWALPGAVIAGGIAVGVASRLSLKLTAAFDSVGLWIFAAVALAALWLAVEVAIRMAKNGLKFKDAILKSLLTPPWQDIAEALEK